MALKLPLSCNKHVHVAIVGAFAPTRTNPDEVNDKLHVCNDLDIIISATPRSDKLVLLGDFDAIVGKDNQTREGVIDPEGERKCNSNGLLLLSKYVEHDLLITDTVFKVPNKTNNPRCIPV